MVRRIKQAAVIGSGVMGSGIAALLASAGIKTLLIDMVPLNLNKEEQNDPKARNRIVKAGFDGMRNANPALLMHPKDADRISIGNLEDNFEQLAQCDWIVEVVVEKLSIKRDLFKRVEAVRKPDAIVSSNTSGIPLKSMSEGLSSEFRRHFLGTHFFNPVRYMSLLEIIPGEETSPEILDFMMRFGEVRLGKTIVRAKDTPNFVGNRIGVQGFVRTAQLMLEEGMSIPEVDVLLGSSMGRPRTAMFKTIDLVGLDTLVHVANNTYELVVDDESRDHMIMPDFINNMVTKNLLGKKTQAGFYKTELTPEWKKIRKVIDPETLEYIEYEKPEFPCIAEAKKQATLPEKIQAIVFGEDKGACFVWRAVSGSLIYSAHRIPEIADTIVEIDKAMRAGYNFELGPFEVWDALGVERTVARMQEDGMEVPEPVLKMLRDGNRTFYKTENGRRFYYDITGGGYKPVDISGAVISLVNLKADNKTIKSCPSASLIDLGDGVVCCEFHTKMNALNAEIVDFIESIQGWVSDNAVGMVIGNQTGGMPGAFSAGADLSYVLSLVEKGRFNDIEAFIKRGQNGIQGSRYADFPVVAAPYGLTLGGGCEVSMGADRIVAHAELYMGQVEVAVGLIPGGGGCLNLWKKFIQNLPEVVTDLDMTQLFIPVFMNIAMAKVSTSAADARSMGFLGPRDRIVFNREHLIGEAKKEVLKMVAEGYAPPVQRPIPVIGENGQGMIAAQVYNMVEAGFISEHDALLANKIAYVLSGGDVRSKGTVDEDVILSLERQVFIELLKNKKTLERIAHTLKTGKPLRN